MIAVLDSMIAVIDPEMPRQIAKWGGTYAGWQNNVTDLRNFKTCIFNPPFVRKELICKEIQNIIRQNKFDDSIDSSLINELTNMTEYPYVYLGKFPKKYLNLPDEVLRYVIQDTQKYLLVYMQMQHGNSLRLAIANELLQLMIDIPYIIHGLLLTLHRLPNTIYNVC